MGTGTRGRLTGPCDTLIAAAAVLIIVAVHRPWFQATLTPPDPAGLVMEPRGAATGLYAHGSLWIATGVAVVQLALLLARHYPGGRLRVRGDGVFLSLGSGLTCLVVAVDMIVVPGPWAETMSVSSDGPSDVPFPWWAGTPDVLGGTTMVMTLSYGAVLAAAAAFASLVAAIVSPGPPEKPVKWIPDRYLSPAAGDGLRIPTLDPNRTCRPSGNPPGRRSRRRNRPLARLSHRILEAGREARAGHALGVRGRSG